MKRLLEFLLRHPVVLAGAALLAMFGAVAGVAHLVKADLARQSRLMNVSCRGLAGTGADAMLVGFVVSDGPQTLVIRGIGPSLAKGGETAALSELVLRVVRHADGVEVGRNEEWNAPGNARLTGDLKHLAPLDPRDAACVLTLEPGGYSALIEAREGKRGVASIEIFVVKE